MDQFWTLSETETEGGIKSTNKYRVRNQRKQRAIVADARAMKEGDAAFPNVRAIKEDYVTFPNAGAIQEASLATLTTEKAFEYIVPPSTGGPVIMNLPPNDSNVHHAAEGERRENHSINAPHCNMFPDQFWTHELNSYDDFKFGDPIYSPLEHIGGVWHD